MALLLPWTQLWEASRLLNQLRLMLQALLWGLLLMLTGLLFHSRSIVIISRFRGRSRLRNAGAGGAAVVLNPGADGSSLVGITVSDNAGVGISIGNVNNVVLDRSDCCHTIRVAGSQHMGQQRVRHHRSKNSCIVRYNNPGTGVYINASGTTIDRAARSRETVAVGLAWTLAVWVRQFLPQLSNVTQEDQESTLRPRSR
jgi:hypothetical protein